MASLLVVLFSFFVMLAGIAEGMPIGKIKNFAIKTILYDYYWDNLIFAKSRNLRNFARLFCQNSGKKTRCTPRWMSDEEELREGRFGRDYLSREIPRVLMREARVEAFMPRRRAAPCSPETFQPVDSKARRIFCRSKSCNSWRV